MGLLLLSLLAGVLTVAAPCILPLLPVVVGGSLVDEPRGKKANLRPLVIALSLALSVIIFTLLLKATTALLGVPQVVWQIFSGIIVILLGVNFVWPHAWELFAARSGLFSGSNKVLGKAYNKKGLGGAVLIGAALGPVFSSCSPTYALIVAVILPASFLRGFTYLVAYALGLSLTLLLVAYVGQKFVSKLKWLGNSNGWFKRVIGILFIVVGVSVLFGLDKQLQSFVIEQGWYDPVSNLEQSIHQ